MSVTPFDSFSEQSYTWHGLIWVDWITVRSLDQEIIEEQCRNNVSSKQILSHITSVISQWISRIGNVHDFPSHKWSCMLQLGLCKVKEESLEDWQWYAMVCGEQKLMEFNMCSSVPTEHVPGGCNDRSYGRTRDAWRNGSCLQQCSTLAASV